LRGLKVHSAETLKNLQASLEAVRQIIDAQRAVMRVVGHEPDLLAAGGKEVMQEWAELERKTRNSVLMH
jgi:hypothetical protein